MNKKSISDLAFLGGEPLFSSPLHVGRPNVGDREELLRRFNDILDRRWFTNRGSYVLEFEERLCEMLGVRNCITMCNGTVALEIAMRALGLKGEVIVPSFTFIATAHALQWQAIEPVFCDIEPDGYTIDADRIEALITPRTTGIVGVHTWGHACRTAALQQLARQHNLRLLFDAAHAFGCSHHDRMIGNFGDAEVFSFHATKFLNTFEGGAVATNDDELAKRIRFMQNFGFAGYDRVEYLGINGKMNEFSAAMGVTSLESMDQFIAAARRNYDHCRDDLADVRGVSVVEYRDDEKRNYQYIVFEIHEEQFGLSRDRVIEYLHAEGVLARRYFFPGCHRMEPYRTLYPDAGHELPVTEKKCAQVVVLPNGAGVSYEQIESICRFVGFLQEHSEELGRPK